MQIELSSTAGISLAGLEVYSLRPEQVTEDVVWLLKDSLAYAEGEMDTGTLLREHAAGRLYLLAGLSEGSLECIVAVEFIQFPLRKSLHILAAAGRVKKFSPFLEFLAHWARDNGCTAIDAWCRESVARLLRPMGFRPIRQMVRLNVERSVQ